MDDPNLRLFMSRHAGLDRQSQVSDTENIIIAANAHNWSAVFALLPLLSEKSSYQKILNELLHLAVAQNDIEAIQELTSKNTSVSYAKDNKTPIELAAELGHWDCVAAIAEAVKTDGDDTAKYGHALLNASAKNQSAAALALVNAGASSGWRNTSCDHTGYFAIHYAIDHNDLVLLEAILKKHPAASKSQHDKNHTPLSLALFKNNAGAVTALLAHGATLTHHSDAIISAAENKKWDGVFACLDSDKVSSSEKSTLAGHLLHTAIAQKDLDKLRKLLTKNPVVNIEKNKKTPVQLAVDLDCWDCVTAIAKAVKTDSDDSARYGSALLNAAEKNQTESATALVAAGASSTWRYSGGAHVGYFAVHYAIDHNNVPLLEAVLKKHPAASKSRLDNSHTPLSLALFRNNAQAATALLVHGAVLTHHSDVIISAAENKKWDGVFACLDSDKVSSSEKSTLAGHLLHTAIAQKDLEKVKKLLTKNPAINIEKNKKTPIELAAELGHWDCVAAIAAAIKTDGDDTAKYGHVLLNASEKNQSAAALALVNAGASSGWRNTSGDHTGYFAIHYAIDHDDLALLKAILEKHGSTAAKSQHNNSVTPLSLALSKNNEQAVKLISQHGGKLIAADEALSVTGEAKKKNWEFVWLYLPYAADSVSLAKELLKIARQQKDEEQISLLFPICYPEKAKLENFKVSCTWNEIKSLDKLLEKILVDFAQNEFLSGRGQNKLIKNFLEFLFEIYCAVSDGNISDVTSKSAILLKLFLQSQTSLLSANEEDRVIYSLISAAILNTEEVSALIPKQREIAGENLSTVAALNPRLDGIESHLNSGAVTFADEETRSYAKRVLNAVRYILNNFPQLDALAQRDTGLINLSGPGFTDGDLTNLNSAVFRDIGLPFHLDYHGKGEQLSQALFRIAKEYISAFLTAEKAGRTKEFFEKSTEGFCLDGKITNVAFWASKYSANHLNLHELMRQYTSEYYAHLEIVEKKDLTSSDTIVDINHATKFIFKHHQGVSYRTENSRVDVLSQDIVLGYMRQTLSLGGDGLLLSKAKEIIAGYKSHNRFFGAASTPELDALNALCVRKEAEDCFFITKDELKAAVTSATTLKKRGAVEHRASILDDDKKHSSDSTGVTAVIRGLARAM